MSTHILADGTDKMWCGATPESNPTDRLIRLMTTATTDVQAVFDQMVRQSVDCPVCQMHYWNSRARVSP